MIGVCPWPARSSIARIWAPKWVLKGRIWTRFRCSSAYFGGGADSTVPYAIRWIASGTMESTPQPKAALEKRSIVQIRALNTLIQAKIHLIEVRAGHGRHQSSTSQTDPRKLPPGTHPAQVIWRCFAAIANLSRMRYAAWGGHGVAGQVRVYAGVVRAPLRARMNDTE